MEKVTVCITSCDRFDLLQKTLDSFLQLNSYPVDKILVTEDSTNPDMASHILNRYGCKIELIFNEYNLGIYRSIDNMYNQVNTEYIFHCEDDWSFSNNSNFMQESVDILEERKDVNRVCVRQDLDPTYVEDNNHFTSTNVEFNLLKNPHCGIWCGFSNNPGLRRKSDYVKMFPNGFASFIVRGEPALNTEIRCNNHAAKLGYRAALLKNRVCTHIGWGRSTI